MKNAKESSISSWIKKSDFGRLISFKRFSAAVTAVLYSLKENGWERTGRIIMSDTHNVVPTQVFKSHMGHDEIRALWNFLELWTVCFICDLKDQDLSWSLSICRHPQAALWPYITHLVAFINTISLLFSLIRFILNIV